ncbi:MAG: c-type cytochrome [Saprospiraceae bacterium]|nr:c-type cytochrome [Saprospiraceae bacterium]
MIAFREFVFYMLVFFMGQGCDDAIVEDQCQNCREEIPSSQQRTGNIEDGKNYLYYGDFVDSGIPSDLFNGTIGAVLGKEQNLNRTGINSGLNFAYTRFITPSGADIVAPNCFQCHAGFVDNQFILGLGNTFADFTMSQAGLSTILDQVVVGRYGAGSREVEAYLPFSRAVKVLGDQLSTDVIGSNSADKLALVLAAHRKQDDLSWVDQPNFPIPNEVYPVDVPAWWLLKKKNAMFHTAEGRGDFARLMMASSLLTLRDSTKAREVDQHFADVKAFIYALDPPPYKKPINNELASQGKLLFENHCSKCHGTYGSAGVYPNLLIDIKEVNTDEAVISFYQNNTSFVDWYNGSWFAKAPYQANLVPGNGYIAPPLDGIWASAPYFHNGSVPSLYDVLKSSDRPKIWRKSNQKDNYDHSKVGLKYEVVTSKTDGYTFDTNTKGYGNSGHIYGDKLTEAERMAVIEYLKTL